jgi:hypothetical protein
MKQSVFVNPVQLVEKPEGMFAEAAPSVVRLQSLDDYLRSRVNATDFKQSATVGWDAGFGDLIESLTADPYGPTLVFVPKDREFGGFGDVVRDWAADIVDRKIVSQGIQTGTQIVETISNEEAERILRDRISGGMKNGSPVARVDIAPDAGMVFVEPGLRGRLQISQVLCRPAYLQLKVCLRVSHVLFLC